MDKTLKDSLGPIRDSLMSLQGDSSLDKNTIEIDLGIESPTSEQDVQKQQEREDKKIGKKGESRKAKHDAKRLHELEQRVLEAERLAEEYRLYGMQKEQEAASQRSVAEAQYDHSLKVKEESARKLLTEAIEEGDVEKQVLAQDLLTQFKTERTINQSYRGDSSRTVNNYYHPNQNYPQYSPQSPPHNPHFEEWLDNNSWCDPHSEDYDYELANEAVAISRDIEKNFKFNGYSHLVGTPEFFQEINDILSNKYKINKHEQSNYARETNPMVAPVSRSNTTRSYSTHSSPNKINLSPDEIEMARKMVYDRHMSDADKIKKYAEQKLMSARRAG